MSPAGPAVLLRKSLTAVGLGLVTVLGPFLLDRWAMATARAGVTRALEKRLGARVSVGQMRSNGPFTLRLERVQVRWPGQGQSRLELPLLEVSFDAQALAEARLRLERIAARGVRFHWRQPRALRSLRTLLARARGRRSSATAVRRPAKPLQLDVRFARLEIQELAPRTNPGLTRLSGRSLVLHRTDEGRWSATAAHLLVRGGGGATLEVERLRWRGRDRRRGGVRTLWVRIGAGILAHTRIGGVRRSFSLVGDEIAPDLLQVRLFSPAAREPHALDLRLDLDALKRRARIKGQVREFPLNRLSVLTEDAGFNLRQASAGGLVDARLEGNTRWTLRTDVQVRNLHVSSHLLGPKVVHWPAVKATLALTYAPRQRRLTVNRGQLTLRGVPLRLSGWIALSEGRLRSEATFELPRVACQRAFQAIPADLVPRLRGLQLAGAIGGHLSFSADSRDVGDTKLTVRIHPNACRVVRDPDQAVAAALKRPFSFTIRPPGWRPTRLVMGPDNPNWRPYSRLGRYVVAAFLAAEDRRFFTHGGFDVESIRRALAENLRSGQLSKKGASSITQQVVKNVFLDHRRTLSRKIQEAILTWRLEQVLTKRRIMEIYLNLVEMGPNLFGIPAAARYYFQLEPDRLNPLQAAHLATITPAPRRHFEKMRDGRAGIEWLKRLRVLLYQMHHIGWLDRPTYEKYRFRDLRLISYR